MVHQSSVLVVLYSLPEAVHRLCDETNSLGIPQYWLSELIVLFYLLYTEFNIFIVLDYGLS